MARKKARRGRPPVKGNKQQAIEPKLPPSPPPPKTKPKVQPTTVRQPIPRPPTNVVEPPPPTKRPTIDPTAGFTGIRGTMPTVGPSVPQVQPPVSVRRPPAPPVDAPAVTPTEQIDPPSVAKTTDRGDRIPPRTPIAKQPIPAQYTNLAKMHYQTPDSTRTVAPNQAEVVRRAEQEKLRLVQLGEYDKAQEIAVKIGQLSNSQNAARSEAIRNAGMGTYTPDSERGFRQATIDETNVGFGGLEQYINMEGIDKLNPYLGEWGPTNPQQLVDVRQGWDNKDFARGDATVQNYLQQLAGTPDSTGGITVGGRTPAPQPTQPDTGTRQPPADGKQIFRDPRDRLAFTVGIDRATLDQLGLDEARKLVTELQGSDDQEQPTKVRSSQVQPVNENLSKSMNLPFGGSIDVVGRVDDNGNMSQSFNG